MRRYLLGGYSSGGSWDLVERYDPLVGDVDVCHPFTYRLDIGSALAVLGDEIFTFGG